MHPGRGQILAAVILFVVGAAGAMQIRIIRTDDTYASARREDLIQLLDGLSSESRRLEGEITQLEQTRATCSQARILSGWLDRKPKSTFPSCRFSPARRPAQGPGIRMRIADPKAAVDAGVLLDAVEEMRDAGAEVIEVNNTIRGRRIDMVWLRRAWFSYRRQAGHPSHHNGGDWRAAQSGGGCTVSRAGSSQK
jgi:uncharacterized protein YlxW (UPF0749 family)